jgi:hypothetical protein
MKYDASHHTLRIFYVSGNVYDYKNVPEDVYEQMKTASSKGTFLNQNIKKRFKFKKVS